MALGITFSLGLFATTVFNESPWLDHTYNRASPIIAGSPAPHRDGRENMVCSTCHIVLPPKLAAARPPVIASAAPPAPPVEPLPQAVSVAMTAVPTPALDPEAHEWMVPYRYQGRVSAIGGAGSRSAWSVVYMQVDDGINPPSWIDLGPRWFLQAAGCQPRPGMFVKGTAFRDPAQPGVTLAYGKTVMTNGDVCALRDNHLEGLWAEAGGTDAEER